MPEDPPEPPRDSEFGSSGEADPRELHRTLAELENVLHARSAPITGNLRPGIEADTVISTLRGIGAVPHPDLVTLR